MTKTQTKNAKDSGNKPDKRFKSVDQIQAEYFPLKTSLELDDLPDRVRQPAVQAPQRIRSS